MAGSAPRRPIVVAPSILSADFGRLAEEVRAVVAAGAEAKLLAGAATLSSDEDGFAAAVDELILPRARNGTGSM
jgi:hypothetical protein